jgi:hypothetical protein
MFNFVEKVSAQAVQTIPTIPVVNANTSFATVVGRFINIALFIGGGIAVLYLIYGGITYVTAGGDQEKATQARTIIVNAIIGIIIIALALALVTWATQAIGITAGAGGGAVSF